MRGGGAWLFNDSLLLLVVFAATVVTVIVMAVLFQHAYVGTDDANIAMVYANHLAQGHGFVYNIGGERVEGFTSFLYVLVSAIAFTVAPWPEFFLLALSVIAITAALVILIKSLEAMLRSDRSGSGRSGPLRLVVVGWALASPAFVFWTTISLMEVALWLLLLTSSLAVVLFEIAQTSSAHRRLAAISMLSALLPLTRPEGYAVAPLVILAYVLARRSHTKTWRALTPAIVLPGASWALAVAGLTVFRLVYFGFPLPNTYYAKVSPDTWHNVGTGVDYLLSFLNDYPMMILVTCAAIAGLLLTAPSVARTVLGRHLSDAHHERRSGRIALAYFVVSLIALAGLVIPVYGGGDFFEGFRFYQPFWLIFGLPIVLATHRVLALIDRSKHRSLRVGRWIAVLALLAVMAGLVPVPWPHQPQEALRDEMIIAEDNRRLGAALNRLFPSAPPTVGVTTAGGVKLIYRGDVFDLLGLNHVAMGHSPGSRYGIRGHSAFDKTIFWKEPPSLVLPLLCAFPIDEALAGRAFSTLSDGILQELFREERFQQRYVLMTVVGDRSNELFEGDPFFFVPSGLPRPGGGGTGHRDAVLIAYADMSIVSRLRSEGWHVTLLTPSEEDIPERGPSGNPCARRSATMFELGGTS